MDYNARMYPYYYAATSFLAFMPIFFLYFSSILDLKEVLVLESIYYISVVILEVPTGYFSDIMGRKKTLVIGAIFLCLAVLFYIRGGSFLVLMLGQILFALHMSFASGTNTVFHYESLENLGIKSSYGDREAIVNKYGMISGGTAALVGGGLATLSLHYAYIITLIAATISLLITLKFKEPSKPSKQVGAMGNMMTQFKTTISYLKVKPLGWIFLFYILTFAITHVPYEFYQPYIELLSEKDMLHGLSVPVVTGLIYAGARYFGAFGAAYSMDWSRKMGLPFFLLFCLLMINLVVLVMGLKLHSIVILVVLFRSLPWAAVRAPINAIITPTIEPGQRATFHSMMSLACRLSFFITLLLMSFVVAKDELANWVNLQRLLQYSFAAGMFFVIPLWWFGKRQFHRR